ncbi:MAG: hypothetical protein EOO93_02660 [Pedobacter sp.]|nr:MAG: hypothetical protein EOO93_02660 [Pedobacter sp.]
MYKSLLFALLIMAFATSCKKKFCGVITAISTETSPANGAPIYKFYLESGEVVPSQTRGNYQIGEGYCND